MNIKLPKDFPKRALGFFPTPLIQLHNLSKELSSPPLFMKRDDLTGLALGGNKTRKLEYILGDALAKGCDTIITAGAAQSNHCRQTAAGAALLEIECHLLLGGEEPEHYQGNVLLDKLLGCQIHWTGENRKGEDIPKLYEQLIAEGKKPYIVPYGGSNSFGALAFAEAMIELTSQPPLQQFSHIIFASSSGGTHAGLLIGKELLGLETTLIGINIDKSEINGRTLSENIQEIANETAAILGMQKKFSAQDILLNSDYVGTGYGEIGNLEREAIHLTASTEGILLDPVYTGRAMGGLIDMIKKGYFTRHDRILFWHTGGAPALFAYSDQLGYTR